MKIKLLSTLALAAGLSSMQAQTVIDIVGSTAGRSSVHSSILASLTNATYGYTGSNIGNANYAIFKGTYGGNSVVIRTSWSGSATGLAVLAAGNNASFIPVATNITNNNVSGLANGSEPSAAEVAFSDVFVGATTVPATGLVNTNTFILPFKWVASNRAIAAGLTNITPLQARALLSIGYLPLSFFTGNASDASVTVYATGRDNGSGTRITALADIGYGVNTTVSQAQVVLTGSNITGLTDFLNAQGQPDPNYGYTSGGTLAGVLNKPSTGEVADVIVLGYLGLSDAVTALSGATPGKELTYNGAAYSPAAVENGEYSFWSYSHLYYKNTLSGISKTYADALGVSLRTNPGSAGLGSTLMTVKRSTDGGNIVPLD